MSNVLLCRHMSDIKTGSGFNEIPESAESLLRLGLGSINEKSWQDRSGDALAEATGALTGPITILGVMNVEQTVEDRSPVIAGALRTYDTVRLLQIDQDPSCRARAQREMLGAHTCALLLSSSPEIKTPLSKLPSDAIEVHIEFATELLKQDKDDRNKTMDPIKRDKYIGGLFVGLRAVFGEATQAIKKVGVKKSNLAELTDSMHPSHQEEEDFARGFSVIAAAIARVTGAIPATPSPDSEPLKDGELLYFPTSFLEATTSRAKPSQLGLVVAETKNPSYLGISMVAAREIATGKQGTIEAELYDKKLDALIDMRRGVHELVLTYGTPAEKSNLLLGFDTIAVALARANPDFVEIIQSLELVPPALMQKSIKNAWLKTQEAASKIEGNTDQGAANEMLGLNDFSLLSSLGDGLNREANHISGISKQGGFSGQDENQEAFRNGGRIHLKILAEIIEKLRTQPPAAEAA